MNKKNNNILIVTIIAIVAGLIAGVAGEILTRNYIFKNVYDFPFSNEWNLSRKGINQDNLVIEGAKKIVVEQNERLNQTIASSKESIVGIFKKKEEGSKDEPDAATTTLDKIKRGNFYNLTQEFGQGLIMTSDGWILTNAFSGAEVNPTEYVIITEDRKIKEIDRIIPAVESGYSFVYVKDAQELPVKNLATENDIQEGEVVLMSNWSENSLITRIIDNEKQNLIKNSDKKDWSLNLLNNMSDYFQPAFIFDLNKNIVGILNGKGKSFSITKFKNQLLSLLQSKEIKTPILGINYINLSDVTVPKENENGALIYPNKNGVAVVDGSPADKADLKQGDVIISVNNQKINKNTDLSSIIQSSLPGDILSFVYESKGKQYSINIQLKD